MRTDNTTRETHEDTNYQQDTINYFDELKKYRILAEDPDPEVARVAKLRVDEVTSNLVRLHYGLVTSYVRRFTKNTTSETAEDFLQAGLFGLLKAINNYDPSRGRFSSWAYKPIQREVLNAVYHSDFQTLRPVDFERRPAIVNEIQKHFPSGENIDTDVIAEALHLRRDHVERVVNAVRLSSLSTPIGYDGTGATLEDLIPDHKVSIEDEVATQQLVRSVQVNGLNHLHPRERYVIVRRFGLDSQPEQKLTEIGKDMNLSREAIRQIESKALAKLAHPALLARIVRAEMPASEA